MESAHAHRWRRHGKRLTVAALAALTSIPTSVAPTLLGGVFGGHNLVAASTSVPFTGQLTGQAYALNVDGEVSVWDTGPVSTGAAGTVTPPPHIGPCIADRDLPGGTVQGACSSVTTALNPPRSTANASVAKAVVDPLISVVGAEATSTSNCVTSFGEGHVSSIVVDGQPVPVATNVAANTTFILPDGKTEVILNEQRADAVSLTVNAVHVISPLQLNQHNGPTTDVVVASAKSDIHNCPPPVVTLTSDSKAVYHDPVHLAATLVDPTTGSPITGRIITFTLGTQTCTTGPTDSDGAASCDIAKVTGNATANGGPSTLTIFSPGNARIANANATVPFTINPEDTAMTYVGDPQVLNGAPATIAGVITEDGATPLAVHPVVLTLGLGSSAQSCAATTNSHGRASCVISSVNQPSFNAGQLVPVTAALNDGNYLDPTGLMGPIMTASTAITGITANPASTIFDDPVTFSATLSQAGVHNAGPLSGKTLTFTLARALDTSKQSCTGTTNGSGVATCSLTPVTLKPDPGAALTVSFAAGGGDLGATSLPVSVPIGKEDSAITYTGDTKIANTIPATLSANLVEDGNPLVGITSRDVVFTMGTGATQQTCHATTDGTGTASCQITPVNQGPTGSTVPITARFAGDDFYLSAATGVNLATLEAIMTGRGYSLGLGPSPSATTVGDTGPVRTIVNGTTASPLCQAANPLLSLVVSGDGLCSTVTTNNGTVTTVSKAADLTIVPLGLHISGGNSNATATCDTSPSSSAPHVKTSGDAVLDSVTLNGTPLVFNHPSPNSVIFVGGIMVVLNEQITHPDGSLTVNAIHVVSPNPLVPDVVLLSSTAGMELCPTPH